MRRVVISPLLTVSPVLVLLAVAGCFRAGFDPPADAAVAPDLDSAPRRDVGGDAAPDGGVAPPDGSPAITVGGLKAAWATPRMIRWSWSAGGSGAAHQRFELVTARSAADVISGAGTARRWTGKDNPELDHFTLPHTGASDPVVSTLTDGHDPATTYHAQLHAIDTQGRRSSSAVVSVTTAPATQSSVVVFADADTKGYSIPAGFKRSTTHPYQGSHHYSYTASCGASKSACWENLRRQDVKLPLSIGAAAHGSSALYEFAVACSGEHSYWSDLSLRFGGMSSELWHFKGWTLRCDGSYRLYQVPLRALSRQPQGPLPVAEVNKGLFEFNTVGGRWTDGSWVHVDEIRIRW